jgi:hypothetical protein
VAIRFVDEKCKKSCTKTPCELIDLEYDKTLVTPKNGSYVRYLGYMTSCGSIEWEVSSDLGMAIGATTAIDSHSISEAKDIALR